MPPNSDQGLLAELQKNRSDLRRFLVARTGNEADADDLLSELWIKITTVATGPISNPRSYLFRTANNLVLDRIREISRRERRERSWIGEHHDLQTSEVIDPSRSAEETLIEQDELRRLAEVISKLPAGARRVLQMHKLDGLSHREIAERLGISKSAVEKHMATAITHLRRLLES